MGSEGGSAQEFQLIVDSSSEAERQPPELRLSSRVVLNRVDGQMPSLRRISAAGTPLTRPVRKSSTRRLSSAITRGG